MQALLGLGWWIVVLSRRRAMNARRDHRTAAFLAYSALAAVGELTALWWSMSIVLALIYVGEWALAGLSALFLAALTVRRLVMEHVTIPLGWYQLTHALGEIDRWFHDDAHGVPRLMAARALARAGVPESAMAWWRGVSPPQLGTYDIAAQAIFADARGDRADARALFESLTLLRAPAPLARELAAEWLALDDADAGRWQAILDRAAAIARPGRGLHRRPGAISAEHAGTPAEKGEPLWPATGLTYFLEGAAARLLGHAEAPSVAGMWVRWLEAPRRRRTWDLLQRALAAAATPAKAKVSVDGVSGGDGPSATANLDGAAPLPGAIALHTAAITHPAVVTVVRATAAWDAALADMAWRTAIAGRAITLGAPPDAAHRAADELRFEVVGDLGAAILAAGVPLPALTARGGDSVTLGAAIARARAELLSRLELTFDRIGSRIDAQGALAPLDEWRSFLAVRAAYRDAARQGGDELERLAFPHAHTELTRWTVWMWNERREQALSHGMTSWLYERALAVGDAQAIELHGKNAQLEPPAE